MNKLQYVISTLVIIVAGCVSTAVVYYIVSFVEPVSGVMAAGIACIIMFQLPTGGFKVSDDEARKES